MPAEYQAIWCTQVIVSVGLCYQSTRQNGIHNSLFLLVYAIRVPGTKSECTQLIVFVGLCYQSTRQNGVHSNVFMFVYVIRIPGYMMYAGHCIGLCCPSTR